MFKTFSVILAICLASKWLSRADEKFITQFSKIGVSGGGPGVCENAKSKTLSIFKEAINALDTLLESKTNELTALRDRMRSEGKTRQEFKEAVTPIVNIFPSLELIIIPNLASQIATALGISVRDVNDVFASEAAVDEPLSCILSELLNVLRKHQGLPLLFLGRANELLRTF